MLKDDPVAIVGLATRVSRHIPEESSFSLILKLIQEAVADAGLELGDINGACVSWPGFGGSIQAGSANWARQLGVRLNWVIDIGLDIGGIRGVLNAAAAIQAGLCDVAVVATADAGGNPGESQADKMNRIHHESDPGRAQSFVPERVHARLEFNHPYGGAGAVHRMALNARRHMHDYGTTSEQMAHVAATIRNHGHINPEAQMYGRGPYTEEDVLNSRMVADPLHLLDCSLVSEGGAAVVLVSAERAKRLSGKKVHVLAGAMEHDEGPHANPAPNKVNGDLGAKRLQVAYGQLGIKPQDLDVLSLYDTTSFEVIRHIEMAGLCEVGEGGAFVEGGRLSLNGGEYPTNTDGGLLSHGWATMGQLMFKVVEGARQLRGDCGDRQVAGAELALCTNSVPAAHHVESIILGKG